MNNLFHSKVILNAAKRFSSLGTYLSRPYSEGPIEILPNIKSGDQRVLSVCENLANLYEDTKVESESGFIKEPYLLGDLNSLRQIAGFPMNPMGSKPPLQEKEKEDERFDRLLKIVTRELTKRCEPTGISINKISSIGFPERTNNIVVKLGALNKFISSFDLIAKMARSTIDGVKTISDWTSEFNFIPIYLEGRRFQHTDRISRQKGVFVPRLRTVYDWTGKTVTVDRSISGYDEFFRTRARFVYGATGHLNYGAQFFSTALRNAMGNDFDFMFYTGNHNFASKVAQFSHALSADVTQFDQNFDERVIMTIIDNIQCYSEQVKDLMRLMAFMPVIQKNDYIGEKGWRVSDDITQKLTLRTGSNPSGWAWVTEFAKICGVTLMCCVVDKYLFRVDEKNISDLLKGRLSVGFLNTGDDMVFLFKKQSDYDAIKNAGSMKFYRFKLDAENIVSYLGMSLRKTSSGIESMLDIRNIPVKLFVPERRIGTVHKPFFAFGLRQKLDIYSKHPLFEKIFYDLNENLVKHFGKGLLELVPLDKSPTASSLTNIADAIFFENPDAIFYKIKPSDVNPELLSSIYAFVPLNAFSTIRHHVKE